MIVKCLVVGTLETNCYLVSCEATNRALVIDPGGDVNSILEEVRRTRLDIVKIINTHGHLDHSLGNGELIAATGAKLLIHRLDVPLLAKGTSLFGQEMPPGPEPDVLLQEGDMVEVEQVRLSVLHTPGHSPGSICLLGEGVVFSGDTLFCGGMGRTDFPGGSYQALLRSIKEKLLGLPRDTLVYPGHGPCTTIGRERAFYGLEP